MRTILIILAGFLKAQGQLSLMVDSIEISEPECSLVVEYNTKFQLSGKVPLWRGELHSPRIPIDIKYPPPHKILFPQNWNRTKVMGVEREE